MRIQRILASLLAADERGAVLGDLAEAGESGVRGVAGVLGLIARRQAELWMNWRPWLALVGFVIPVALALHFIALYDFGLFGVRALREDVPWFARLVALTFGTLMCWSYLGGGVLRTVAPRTLVVQIPALLGVMIVAQVAGPLGYVVPAHRGMPQDSAHNGIVPWVIQLVLVAGPLVYGTHRRLPSIAILGVIFTVAEFICQFTLRHQFNQHLPISVTYLAVYWPFAYLAVLIGKGSVRLSQPWS